MREQMSGFLPAAASKPSSSGFITSGKGENNWSSFT